jgi:hypothetical protein
VPRTWYRPYPPGKARWVIAMWEVGALALFHRTTVDLFSLDPRTGAGLAAILAATWAIGCWRLAQMGLYTGEAGLQIRGLLTRRTISWPNIARILTDDVGYELGKLRIPAGRTILIELLNGGRVNSTLWAEGVDFKFKPALFQETYERLRSRHIAMNQIPAGAPGHSTASH